MSRIKQYINIITSSNQLKVDYQLLEDDQILKNEQSVFLMGDKNTLPSDAVTKLNALQATAPESVISLLLNDTSYEIANKDITLNDSEAILNDEKIIKCDSNLIFETKHRFEPCGIDFIFSPFSILYLHIEQNLKPNKLNILILENNLYALITDEQSKISKGVIKTLTPFEKIKESQFYENDVIRQKLFDEIYLLEVTNIINSIIKEFYKEVKVEFIESIDILYTLKQLSQEDIDTLKDEIYIDINYIQISLDESVYELAKKEKKRHSSFIEKRKPKKSSSRSKWFLGTIASTAAAAAVFYFMNQTPQQVMQYIKPQAKQPVKQKTDKKTILLPNHINKNMKIEKDVKFLLDIIPYNVVIQEVILSDNSSFMTAEFLEQDVYIKELQPKLLSVYKESELSLKDEKAKILTGTIVNKNKLKQKSVEQSPLPKYIVDEKISRERVTEQLKEMLPKDSLIKYKSDFKSDVLTYNFFINTVLSSPADLYKLIEEINRELYSINLSYPLSLRKNAKGIEAEFNMQFHQNK